MSIQKFYELIDIPDYRYIKDKSQCEGFDYDCIAEDCDTKTISLLDAIKFLGNEAFSEISGKSMDKEKLLNLCGVIAELTELAIATNKIAMSASYSSGFKDGENVSCK